MANKKEKLSPETIAKIKATKEAVKIHQITENYRIVGRRDEFTPEEKKVNKTTGEVTWSSLGHHTKLGSSILSISVHITRDHIDDLLYVASQLDRIEAIALEMNGKQL